MKIQDGGWAILFESKIPERNIIWEMLILKAGSNIFVTQISAMNELTGVHLTENSRWLRAEHCEMKIVNKIH